MNEGAYIRDEETIPVQPVYQAKLTRYTNLELILSPFLKVKKELVDQIANSRQKYQGQRNRD